MCVCVCICKQLQFPFICLSSYFEQLNISEPADIEQNSSVLNAFHYSSLFCAACVSGRIITRLENMQNVTR